jgi:hypothetical protein
VTTDSDLIAAIRKAYDGWKVSAERRARIEAAIKSYIDACDIARGPDPGSKKRWERKARERRRELKEWFRTITGRVY